jgi:hypothetical protein
MNVTDLRKAFSAQGLKGFSSANRAAFTAAIEDAEIEAYAENVERFPVKVAPVSKTCGACEIRKPYTGPGEKAPRLSELCNPCFEEGSWENEHDDNDHESGEKMDGCWICYPNLNAAKRAPRAGRSRAGMVIVAKGTEIHKSATFKAAAEAAGWSVKILDTFEGTEEKDARYVATATKGNDSIELSWNGKAYDYPNSSAQLNGRSRKVRNLKEALRLL